jgi:hypothetical protein
MRYPETVVAIPLHVNEQHVSLRGEKILFGADAYPTTGSLADVEKIDEGLAGWSRPR